jgi:acyl-CoA synthetase (AMP-forming)/AMP-acid ligase II
MTNLLLSLLTTYAKRAKADFVRKTRQPMIVQEHFLRELLQIQQGTELGQQFGLGGIKTIDQFRAQVPVWSYSDYEPYTDRIAQGEPNVLNADPVVYINLTSGSTGKQKQVPVTRRFQASLRRANLACVGFLDEALKVHSAGRSRPLQFGKLLTANSARLQGYTQGGIEYGPVTVGSLRAGTLGSLSIGKFVQEQTLAHPFDVLEIADSLSRHYVCLLFALCNPNLRGIAANFPMLVLRICNYLETYADELIQDIEQGTIAPWLALEPEIRARLEHRWSASPQRASQLRQIVKTTGKLTPKDAWANLSMILTARGGTSDFYFERFPDYLGDTPSFGGVFGTAEGNFGVYYDLNTDGSILALESGFYEFIPEEQWDEDQPKTLLPVEVKVGDRYRILVTSYSGFYRYDIGDVVEVVGFFEQTPLIVFRHRRGGLLSSTTEKTSEFHATQAMQALLQEFSLGLEDFCITLSEREFPAHYLVNIELAAGQSLSQPEAFLARFDYWLGQFNHPYATVRNDQVPPPRLRVLAPGSFAIVRQRQLKRGTSDSQLKFPHISEDRTFLDELQVVQEVRLSADVSGEGIVR